jgi:hypothetical protein
MSLVHLKFDVVLSKSVSDLLKSDSSVWAGLFFTKMRPEFELPS